MAASAKGEGGYDFDFVSIPDDSLHCRICLSVARDPRQHSKCGQLFCYTCLQKYKRMNARCPYCKEDSADCFEDNRSHRQIQSLIVRCHSKHESCTWQGELRYLQDHTANKCDYREVNCPLECDTTMKWVTLDHHLKEVCPNRLIKCSECGEEGPYWSITTDHKKECLYILEKCPAPGCDVEMCSVLMAFHLQTECEYSLVECKYRGVGCTAILTRRHMEEHENNDRYHLKLLAHSHTLLQEKYKELEASYTSQQEKYEKFFKSCNELQKSVTLLELKLEENSLYSSTSVIPNKDLLNTSVTFYATPQTYKFEATFIRPQSGLQPVCVQLIEGENDHSIDWPFSGQVKVQILNPLEDKDHLTKTVNIPSQERPGHAVLRKVFSTNDIHKYEYNGNIYIRFTVHSDFCKHWLK